MSVARDGRNCSLTVHHSVTFCQCCWILNTAYRFIAANSWLNQYQLASILGRSSFDQLHPTCCTAVQPVPDRVLFDTYPSSHVWSLRTHVATIARCWTFACVCVCVCLLSWTQTQASAGVVALSKFNAPHLSHSWNFHKCVEFSRNASLSIGVRACVRMSACARCIIFGGESI